MAAVDVLSRSRRPVNYFNGVRVVIHLAALLPASLLIYGALQASLGADPQEVILHTTGSWALKFLLLSLFITPLRKWTGFNRLILLRRPLGPPGTVSSMAKPTVSSFGIGPTVRSGDALVPLASRTESDREFWLMT